MGAITVGSVLPWIRDVTDARGRLLDWRDTQRNRVVLFTHGATCEQCVEYAHRSFDGTTSWHAGMVDCG